MVGSMILDAQLGWENKHRSYRLLRTVLQAMRDWLTVDDAAGFGAQLPGAAIKVDCRQCS